MGKWKKTMVSLFGLCIAVGILVLAPKVEVEASSASQPTQIYVSPGETVSMQKGTNNVYVKDSAGVCVPFTAYYYDSFGGVSNTSSSSKNNDSAYGYANETVFADGVYVKATCEQVGNAYNVHIYREEASSSEEQPASDGGSCEHHYEWVTKTEATEITDAVLAYQCSSCGHILHHMTEANSAFGKFNQDAVVAIQKAPANGTVVMDTNMWTSFRRSVMSALSERTDVTLTVKYRYEGKRYTVTIPAGSDALSMIDENGYCGFRSLDSKFCGSELTVG